MTAVLLDTTVASRLHLDLADDPMRQFFVPHLRHRTWSISFQTYAELYRWAEASNWGQRRRTSLHSFITKRLVLVPFELELGQVWARVMTQSQRAGRRLEAGDAWIAATAVLYSVPLLTTDRDFLGLGIDGFQVVHPAS